jgi:hypothetical protein
MLQLDLIGAFRSWQGTFPFSTNIEGYTDYVVLAPDVEKVSVQVSCDHLCNVMVQATLNSVEEIEAGTAIWKDWTLGKLSGPGVLQDATTGPITAVRCKNTGLGLGNFYLTVRAKGEQLS